MLGMRKEKTCMPSRQKGKEMKEECAEGVRSAESVLRETVDNS